MPKIENITENTDQVSVDTTEVNKKILENSTENFFKAADGSYKWLNIGGTLAVATGLFFGVRFLIKKFKK